MFTKFLFQPVKPFIINQYFSENKACLPINGGKVIFCDGLNPPIGYRSVYSNKGHNGLDLRAYHAQPVYASQDGIVIEVVDENKRGIGLGIVTKEKYFCVETGKDEYFKIRYWHNKINLVKLGQEVNAGELITLADNTGYSSGDHLHFELKPVYLTDGGKWYNVLQNNGFHGAVDPLQYMEYIEAKAIGKLVYNLSLLTGKIKEYLDSRNK